MDRLPTLIALCALVACDKDSSKDEPTSRVNAAKTQAKPATDTAAFCDKKFDRETAPEFKPPELAGGSLAASSSWRWVNVWATYCKPCIEEMPRLAKWRDKIATKYELQFVSMDEAEDDVTAFRKLHPDTPPSARLKPDAQGAWFTQLGLDAGAPIPVHIFVDPSNHVRCVRAGGVREQDFGMIEALFAGK